MKRLAFLLLAAIPLTACADSQPLAPDPELLSLAKVDGGGPYVRCQVVVGGR